MFPSWKSGDANDYVGSSARGLMNSANSGNAVIRETPEHCVFRYLVPFTRFWGVFTAIVLCGVGIDTAVHRHVTGYYLIGGSIIIVFLEVMWAITLFIQLCARNEQSRALRCWRVVASVEGWKKTILYGPVSAIPLVWPHNLWLSYVVGGQLIALAIFHLVLSFRCRRRRRHKDRLTHGDIDSFESSRFEEVTDILDDGLPQPIPGSSHSLSDSLTERDTVLEI